MKNVNTLFKLQYNYTLSSWPSGPYRVMESHSFSPWSKSSSSIRFHFPADGIQFYQVGLGISLSDTLLFKV